MTDLAPDGIVEAQVGDYELVKLRDGALIIRCRHCKVADAGGRRDMVMSWWQALTGDVVPVHTSCTAKLLN